MGLQIRLMVDEEDALAVLKDDQLVQAVVRSLPAHKPTPTRRPLF